MVLSLAVNGHLTSMIVGRVLVGRSAEGGQCQFYENLLGQSHQVMHPKHLIREAKFLKYTSSSMYTNEKKKLNSLNKVKL